MSVIVYKIQGQKSQHMGQREDTKVIDVISNARKNEVILDRWTFGDHTTRKDDKGDEPSGGETTWANTGAT